MFAKKYRFLAWIMLAMSPVFVEASPVRRRGRAKAAERRQVRAPSRSSSTSSSSPISTFSSLPTNFTLQDLVNKLPAKALFYLVGADGGTPLASPYLGQATGSRSIALSASVAGTQLLSLKPAPTEWISAYLEKVKGERSKQLTADSLNAFNKQWSTQIASYTPGLQKIWKVVTLSAEQAQTAGLVAQGVPITCLFLVDPYPAHTLPGTARTSYVDRLAEFIKASQSLFGS